MSEWITKIKQNQSLDKQKHPTNQEELFEAWDRAFQDRKLLLEKVEELILEMEELSTALKPHGHNDTGVDSWGTQDCFDGNQGCFCKARYYGSRKAVS